MTFVSEPRLVTVTKWVGWWYQALSTHLTLGAKKRLAKCTSPSPEFASLKLQNAQHFQSNSGIQHLIKVLKAGKVSKEDNLKNGGGGSWRTGKFYLRNLRQPKGLAGTHPLSTMALLGKSTFVEFCCLGKLKTNS